MLFFVGMYFVIHSDIYVLAPLLFITGKPRNSKVKIAIPTRDKELFSIKAKNENVSERGNRRQFMLKIPFKPSYISL